MSIEELKRPERIDEERIEKLKELFPEAFGDGKLNIETLRDEIYRLDEDVLEDNIEEFYGFQWVGKKEARKLSVLPPKGTLKILEGEGINEEQTKNIFIEGDNLEVLRLLQKSYSGKIKMIYIDPPYNTGNDLIYKDDFKEPVESYLQKSLQADDEGLLTSNPKANGRYHANWLNMIYPRLRLSKSLLKDDGIIFVSIDDNEQANLKKVMDEIFGEVNFIGCVSVVNNFKGRSDEKYIATAHEYLLIYQKGNFTTLGVPLPEEYIGEYNEEDERGKYRLQGLRKRGSSSKREDRPKMYYPFYYDSSNDLLSLEEMPNSFKILPKLSDGSDGRWRWGIDTSKENIELLTAKYISSRNEYDVYQKDYLHKDGKEKTVKPKSFWMGSEFSSDSGTLSYKQLFKNNVFQNPKPLGLIKYCLNQSLSENDIVLDFYAGSGSTAQAVMEFNEEKEKKCKFILVQLPERINNKEYPKISEITKERIRRSINKLNNECENIHGYDRGFKAYKLERSNLKKWEMNEADGRDISSLTQKLDLFSSSPINTESNDIDIVIELMLHQGFPLESKIEKVEINNNSYWLVKHEDFQFPIVVYLEEKLHEELENIMSVDFEGATFICIDDALTNKQKILLSEKMNVKTI
ncbi:site-specific DNA-methyltransferase [uncultured Planococcus sp.]|uniref:site-specific DNA-methyltransferase n=1 Tax=uncultured Planococcus sp. TaxID=337815 RepID=UPI00260F9271|nr:site-specific DNA-methyltransferase [uncultured Planococcus sp.]